MQLGDILRIVPTVDVHYGIQGDPAVPCTVVYIHPEKRFAVVEFCHEITGARWREAVEYPDRPNIIREPAPPPGQWGEGKHFNLVRKRKGAIYENDCNYEQQRRRGKNRNGHQSGGYPGAAV